MSGRRDGAQIFPGRDLAAELAEMSRRHVEAVNDGFKTQLLLDEAYRMIAALEHELAGARMELSIARGATP